MLLKQLGGRLERRRRAHPRRVGLEDGRGRRPVRPRPSGARRPADADGQRGLRAARRSSRRRSSCATSLGGAEVGSVPRSSEARRDDVRRGVSTVGPHRDDLELFVDGMPARTHASQGEQRTLALGAALGAHRLVTDKAGSAPVLVLDDVLSELDPGRCQALLQHLPRGQVVLTTAGVLPDGGSSGCDRAHRSWHGGVMSREPVPIGESLEQSGSVAAQRRVGCRSRRLRWAGSSAVGSRRSARPWRPREAGEARRHAARCRGRRSSVGDAVALSRDHIEAATARGDRRVDRDDRSARQALLTRRRRLDRGCVRIDVNFPSTQPRDCRLCDTSFR